MTKPQLFRFNHPTLPVEIVELLIANVVVNVYSWRAAETVAKIIEDRLLKLKEGATAPARP